MCTTFLVNETLSSGRCGNYFRSFFMTDFHPRGIHSAGMSIFLLFLRRLWIALDANSHAVLKQCVARNRYARKNCEIFSKCLRCVSLSNECGHVENSYVFINNTNFEFYTLFCLVYHPTKDTANKVEGSICTYRQLSIIKVRISPLPRADLWQIFAGLASIAIALQTLFEHRVRVCL